MSLNAVKTFDSSSWLQSLFSTARGSICWHSAQDFETDSDREEFRRQRARQRQSEKDRSRSEGGNKAIAFFRRKRSQGNQDDIKDLASSDDSEVLRRSQHQEYQCEREDNRVSADRQNQREIDYWPVTHPDKTVREIRKEDIRRRKAENREARRIAAAEGRKPPSPGPQTLTFPIPNPSDYEPYKPSRPNSPLQSAHRREASGVSLETVLVEQVPSTSAVRQQVPPVKLLSSRNHRSMTPRAEVTYFGAGPALLPTSVLEKAAQALVNYNETGLGIAEHSHRSALATDIVEQTKADLKTYLDIPDDYEVLFMQAGGSGEFSATVTNFAGFWVERRRQQIIKSRGQEVAEADLVKELQKAVDEELKLDYIVTGSWSLKASQEAARLLGPEKVNVVVDARRSNDGKFGKIPSEDTWNLSKQAAMIYYCDNETVDGVEFPAFPKRLEPGEEEPIVVADMSSNILSRRIPIKNFSLIFFGAQKNLGSTGITVVIIKKNLLPPVLATPEPSLMRKLGLPIGPIVLDYATIAKNKSLYNTLSIFDVYVAGEVLKTLLAKHPNKVDGQQSISDQKARLIYGALDAHPESYRVVPDKSSRSRMNICFRVTHGGNIDEAEKAFIKGAEAIGLLGLKGHRSVGGIRASNYNSIDLEGAQKLGKYIEDFARKPLS